MESAPHPQLTPPALPRIQESTLKSVLSALWNLSAHSTENKAAICQVDGALGFLVSTLTYKCQSNSLAIIESGGGILRNVSSLIATREDYRWVPHLQWRRRGGGGGAGQQPQVQTGRQGSLAPGKPGKPTRTVLLPMGGPTGPQALDVFSINISQILHRIDLE